jgi:hypothetical protein
LQWLQDWVVAAFGSGPVTTANPWFSIETNDPGWTITVSLTGTAMEATRFEEFEIERSKADWLHCWVDGGVSTRDVEWQGRGGERNLTELIATFRAWVES